MQIKYKYRILALLAFCFKEFLISLVFCSYMRHLQLPALKDHILSTRNNCRAITSVVLYKTPIHTPKSDLRDQNSIRN